LKIFWSVVAVEDREAVFDYLAERNPEAAIRIDTEIERAVELLAEHPLAGRPGRVAGTRELVLSKAPYVIVYFFVVDNTINVLRVLHTARQWP